MDSIRRRNKETVKPQERIQKLPSMVDQFLPTIEWSHDRNTHILLVDLPGFHKDDIRVQVDSSGKLTVKGTRMGKDNKSQRVEQMFQVPDGINIDQISGRLDEGRLTLIMPRKETDQAAKQFSDVKDDDMEKKMSDGNCIKKDDKNEETGSEDADREKNEEEKKCSWDIENRVSDVEDGNGMMEMVMEKMVMEKMVGTLSRNKKMIAMAVVAFTVGFYVSRRLRSSSA